MILGNIFAATEKKNNPKQLYGILVILFQTEKKKIKFHGMKMLKPYQMFLGFKSNVSKFRAGEATLRITFVGLRGELSPPPIPCQGKHGHLCDQFGSQPHQEAFTAVKQYLFEIQTAYKIAKITCLLETRSIENNSEL